MFFAASKIIWWLMAPLNAISALLALGVALQTFFRRPACRKWGLRLSSFCVLFLLAVWLLPVGSWALMPLEERFSRPAVPPASVDGIIVLGGVVELSSMRGREGVAFNGSAERIWEMARLARLYPEARILYTSGSGLLRDQDVREADEVRAHVAEIGIDPERFIWERDSRNTYENAIFSKKLAKPKPGEVWLLVTSAFHMPRSVGIFRKAGWPVVPWPVDWRTAREGPASMDALEGVDRLNVALREWIGLTAYHFSGKTDAWFPEPAS